MIIAGGVWLFGGWGLIAILRCFGGRGDGEDEGKVLGGKEAKEGGTGRSGRRVGQGQKTVGARPGSALMHKRGRTPETHTLTSPCTGHSACGLGGETAFGSGAAAYAIG